MIYCKSAGKNVTEDGCHRARGFNPASCNGCPVPPPLRVRPGLYPRQESPPEPSWENPVREEPAPRPEGPWHHRLIKKRVLEYTDEEWQEILFPLRLAKGKKTIPKNLRDEITKLMRRYVVHKTQWTGAPGVGEIRRDLDALCKAAEEFTHCAQRLNDATLYRLDWESCCWEIKFNQPVRHLVEDTGRATRTIALLAAGALTKLPGKGTRTLTGGEIPGRYQVIQALATVFASATGKTRLLHSSAFQEFVSACFARIEDPPGADAVLAALKARHKARQAK